MTSGKQTTALALAGAVALASGAYALGTQADDGSAAAGATAGGKAAGHGHGFGPGRPGMPPGLEDLADRLGVDEDKLRGALDDIAAERRTGFAQRLADALGIDRAKVEQALEDMRPERPRMRPPEALAGAVAKELGLGTAKVRAALERHRGDLDAVADALGVSEQRLHDAFHAVLGTDRSHRPGPSNLAKELGVSEAQLEAAFEKLREQHDGLRGEFAQELADRLNLDAAKVQDALDDLHPPRFERRHP